MICGYCGKKSEGIFSIHRDGPGKGPEIWLCNQCGFQPRPTPLEIWARTAQPDPLIEAMQEVFGVLKPRPKMQV